MLHLFWTQNIPVNISTSAHVSWGDKWVVSYSVSRVALLLYDNVEHVPCGTPLLCVLKERGSATLHVLMGNNPVSAAPWTHQKTYHWVAGDVLRVFLWVLLSMHLNRCCIQLTFQSRETLETSESGMLFCLCVCVFLVSFCFVGLLVFLWRRCWLPLCKSVNHALMSSKLWNKTFATTWHWYGFMCTNCNDYICIIFQKDQWGTPVIFINHVQRRGN